MCKGSLKSITAGAWIFVQTKPPDSYVAVSVDKQPPRKTKIVVNSNTPSWEESFTL